MKTFEVKTVRVVTAQEIDDIMVTALEGGINYWCDAVKVDKPPTEEYKYASDVLTRGGTLKVYVSEEDEIQVLTIEKLIKGLEMTEFNFDDYDAGDVDNVIQRALFGDVIYG